MGKCKTISNLKLDQTSIDTLKRIDIKNDLGRKLQIFLVPAQIIAIITGNLPEMAITLYNTDLALFHKGMKGISKIVKNRIQTEIDLMIIHYDHYKKNKKHAQFWKALKHGCT